MGALLSALISVIVNERALCDLQKVGQGLDARALALCSLQHRLSQGKGFIYKGEWDPGEGRAWSEQVGWRDAQTDPCILQYVGPTRGCCVLRLDGL